MKEVGETCAETTIRLRLDLAYDGTDFHGWAKQKDPDIRTVQGELERALSLIFQHDTALTVAGRTDAGVHATGQVAHCDVDKHAFEQRSIDGDPNRMVRRLARLLDDDIRVQECQIVPPEFDARFSALRRHYSYRLTTARSGALPTRRRDTATWPKPVELSQLQLAADQLTGLHDFAAFCRAKPHATTVRDLQGFTWYDISTAQEPELYEARVSADAFCWSMVRSLVGCALAVAEGRRDDDFPATMLNEAKRSSLIPVAPANGLTLTGVDYPSNDSLVARNELTRTRRMI